LAEEQDQCNVQKQKSAVRSWYLVDRNREAPRREKTVEIAGRKPERTGDNSIHNDATNIN